MIDWQDLAERAVACRPKFIWFPGMLSLPIRDEFGDVVHCSWRVPDVGRDPWPLGFAACDGRPDFRDKPTVGALGWLVRRAWGEEVTIVHVDGPCGHLGFGITMIHTSDPCPACEVVPPPGHKWLVFGGRGYVHSLKCPCGSGVNEPEFVLTRHPDGSVCEACRGTNRRTIFVAEGMLPERLVAALEAAP